ncbi:MAG: class I SAM-dependent methyltransferase [Candidatus Falkowbacteria bacterium]|nr:class I SAM-dependent methyltransferase [Candidatus Falkowbacteria bacterium]
MDQKTEKNLLKIVKANYQDIADVFNTTRKKEIWPEIKKLAQEIKAGDRILDVGCGNGRLLEVLKDKQIEYLGVDQSESLIDLAQTNYPGFRFKLGNILDLGQTKEHNFDYVFCLAVFHHLPSDKLRIQALKQLKNKLNPQGKIIISVWNLWGYKKQRFLIWRFWLLKLLNKHKMKFGDVLFSWKNSAQQIISQRYYHAFNKQQLKKIIKKSGLNSLELYRDKYNYWAIINKK